MNGFDRGDIVWAFTPRTDGKGEEKHPALIVGDPLSNNSGDYVLIQVTSSTWKGSTDYILHDSDPEFQRSGLDHTSTFRCHKLFVMAESRVRRKLGTVGPNTLREIEIRLKHLLKL